MESSAGVGVRSEQQALRNRLLHPVGVQASRFAGLIGSSHRCLSLPCDISGARLSLGRPHLLRQAGTGSPAWRGRKRGVAEPRTRSRGTPKARRILSPYPSRDLPRLQLDGANSVESARGDDALSAWHPASVSRFNPHHHFAKRSTIDVRTDECGRHDQSA